MEIIGPRTAILRGLGGTYIKTAGTTGNTLTDERAEELAARIKAREN